VATIHQRLVDEHGLVASVASLRRWVPGNLPEKARRARVPAALILELLPARLTGPWRQVRMQAA